jgi:hypothetical protein
MHPQYARFLLPFALLPTFRQTCVGDTKSVLSTHPYTTRYSQTLRPRTCKAFYLLSIGPLGVDINKCNTKVFKIYPATLSFLDCWTIVSPQRCLQVKMSKALQGLAFKFTVQHAMLSIVMHSMLPCCFWSGIPTTVAALNIEPRLLLHQQISL